MKTLSANYTIIPMRMRKYFRPEPKNIKTMLRYQLSIHIWYHCLTKTAVGSHSIAHALNDQIDSVNPGMVRTFSRITKIKLFKNHT